TRLLFFLDTTREIDDARHGKARFAPAAGTGAAGRGHAGVGGVCPGQAQTRIPAHGQHPAAAGACGWKLGPAGAPAELQQRGNADRAPGAAAGAQRGAGGARRPAAWAGGPRRFGRSHQRARGCGRCSPRRDRWRHCRGRQRAVSDDRHHPQQRTAAAARRLRVRQRTGAGPRFAGRAALTGSAAHEPTSKGPAMSKYDPPLRDMQFALFDVLDAEALFQRLPGCAHATRELVEAVLEESARFTRTVLAPLNSVGDEHGCSFDPESGAVGTPPGFREAYRQFVDNGWAGLTVSEEYGGQGLPATVGAVSTEMIDAANLSWGTYPLLSHGQVEALKHHGEQWQRDVFLSAIASGRWTGTMCLTEPHCGTDLGLLRTRAEPIAGDRYAVTGTKIFITAGEHDLTDNI